MEGEYSHAARSVLATLFDEDKWRVSAARADLVLFFGTPAVRAAVAANPDADNCNAGDLADALQEALMFGLSGTNDLME